MGVHGLWELLSPVGRRVSVETLAGKRLAIDASIWMIQFMKAMRDEKGDMVRNAHVLGFFRRILKLLFLRTKPVFVFDGGTPALKRRTVVARRRQRENSQAKIRKTAEKLLLNHVKVLRMKELAAELEIQKQKNDIKGKKAILEEPNIDQNKGRGADEVARSYSQEELDEMLAASLDAEENGGFAADASASGPRISGNSVGDEDQETDEEEEMILPELHGKIDPAVLASLPPSMQLDLLVQMRERLMAENRQKYQKVKKVPARFSELQIQAYLKTVAFRREIDGVHRSAAGKGIGGVQTSRIASEANREFIFSSSFTGDKQAFTSDVSEKVNGDMNQYPSTNSSNNVVNEASPIVRSGTLTGLIEDQTTEASEDEVNTYLDERGRVRVSRVRALGIHMTRDLQRNLDLMREVEQEKEDANQNLNEATAANVVDDVIGKTSDRIQHHESEDQVQEMHNNENNIAQDPSMKIGSMEISFEFTRDEERCNDDDDDDLFSSLVAGQPIMGFPIDPSATYSHSDSEWEGVVKDKTNMISNEYKSETQPSLLKEGIDDAEVEWEEGFQGSQENNPCYPHESQKIVSKGALIEQEEFQEAVRRSLDDMVDHRPMNEPFADQCLGTGDNTVSAAHTWQSGHDGKGTENEQPSTVVHKSLEFSISPTVTETNSLEANCSPCMHIDSPKTHINQKLLDQNVHESVVLLEGASMLSSNPPEDQVLNQAKEKIIGIHGLGGNGHASNNPISTCSGDFELTSSRSAVSCSVAYAASENLPDHDYIGAHYDMFHGAIDGRSCEPQNPGKIFSYDSTTEGDGLINLTNEKIYIDSPMIQDKPSRNLHSINDDGEHSMQENNFEEEILLLQKERDELETEQWKHERNAESVTSEMFAECQELLQMFGLPYIIAPMEAEAQCAYMELLNLVDGVVTDDSDAFLFGARSVYKNIFDDRKYVETYLMKDIENELGMNRDNLISMALLLGSDYTEGISGIGIVNAIEVVNAFPEKGGLHEFRDWIESPDPTILGNFGSKTKSKATKTRESLTHCSNDDIQGSYSDKDDTKKMKELFMDKHRNVSKNWQVPSSFPSDAVISAYASPQVDKSTETFSWGKPDLFALRKLCWDKFGWDGAKANELLLPVLKEYNKHETQLRIEAFYTFNERFAKIRSKRIRKAVKGITGNKSSELMSEEISQQTRLKKRKVKSSLEEANKSATDLKPPEGVVYNQTCTTEESNFELSKSGHEKEQASPLYSSNLTQSTAADKSRNSSKRLHKKRQKEQVQGKPTNMRKMKASFADSKTTYDEHINHDASQNEGESISKEVECVHHVRRSERLQKTMNYCIPEDSDDCDEETEAVENRTKDSLLEQTTASNDGVRNEVKDLGTVGEIFADESGQENIFFRGGTSQTYEDISNHQALEYLQFGGGFCLDEEEDNRELCGVAETPTREVASETCTVSHSVAENPEYGVMKLNSGKIPDESRDAHDKVIMNDDDDDNPKVSTSAPILNHPEDTVNDSEKLRFESSLRAMPNLRRKRRKT